MSHFRSIFRQISINNSYQVSNYGPRNNAFTTFSPSGITGLRTWIDVSDSAYVTSSGGYIDTINNKAAAGGTFKPTSRATAPYLSASSINTRDSAGFDGVDDILTSSISAASAFGYADPPPSNQVTSFTIGVAFRPNRINASAGQGYSLDTILEEGNASIVMTLGSVGAVTNRLWFDYGSITSTDYVTSSAGDLSAGRTVCAVVTMLTKSYDLYVNGTYKNTVARSFNPTATAAYLALGNTPRAGTPAKLDLCELVVYSGSLSPGEISSLSTYLKDRWGIT